MSDLARDWLLDPLALLFLSSVLAGLLWVFAGRAGRSSGRSRGRRRRSTSGRRLILLVAWCACFLLVSAPAVVNPLVARLEGIYPPGLACPAGTPVVVLGGGVDSRIDDEAEYERMRPATLARVAAAERIASTEPGVSLILSGGGLGGDTTRVAEAAVMGRFLRERSTVPRSLSVVEETLSGSTAENAREVASLLRAQETIGETGMSVRLLTSAMHMPRALATFQGAGIDACPVSVGIVAIENVPAWALMPQTTALVKFDALLHELAAFALYRVRGEL